MTRSSRADLDPAEPLTPRESDVLDLLVAGHSNKEIARLLALSPKTVERYISTASHKLVTDRDEAGQWRSDNRRVRLAVAWLHLTGRLAG